MTDPIWRSHNLKTVLNSDFNLRWRIQYGGYIYVFRESQGFWCGKCENYYPSVWRITTNLIANLNSAIENPILQSHTWCFDRIHIIPYLFVRNILKRFPHLSCHKSFFQRFELIFIGIYIFDDIFFSKYLHNLKKKQILVLNSSI